MDDRIKQIIGSRKNAVSTDTDTNLTISFDNTSRLVKTNSNQINSIIGVDDQFNLERHESTLYRMLGRINLITANELTQGDGGNNRSTTDTDWDPLFTEFLNSNGLPVRTPNNWVVQICYPSKMIDTYPVWGVNKPISLGMEITSLSSNNPSGNRSLLVITTTQKHKLSEGDYVHINDIVNTNQYQGIHKVFELGENGSNLDTKVTLETSWKGDITNQMFLNRVVNTSDEDVQFIGSTTMSSFNDSDISGTTTNTNYITVTTSVAHDLGVNDYVELRNPNGGFLNGFHRVTYIVDDFKYTIRSLNTAPSPTGYKYRRMDGTPSDYYVREFELLTANDYETYNAAFSSSIYPETAVSEFGISNGTWLFHFNKDVDTYDLISHRGGIVNELKVCFLKRAGEFPFDWSNVTSHWEFDFGQANTTNGLETVSTRVVGGVGTIEKNTSRTIYQEGEKYIGDIVEYNRKEIREKVLTEVVFRFGIHSGVITNNNIPPNPALITGIETITTANPNLEGYYYKPFKTMDIKKFSNTIEDADPEDNVAGIPADFELYSDGSMSWRDLLPDGFIEEGTNGVNWPFLNGRHYIYSNNYIYIRRQNPYVVIDQSGLVSVNPKNVC